MKGDFSRVSFNRAEHFSRVLMQQGRVTLDADHNEQADIVLHMLRTLARDLFGQYGGPKQGRGFGLYFPTSNTGQSRLMIGAGHYYVDGILCENEAECDYADQPDYQPGDADPFTKWLSSPQTSPAFWLYLDVWERHITWVEDDHIREVALGGPDTCTRAKVVWQVKAVSLPVLIDMLTKKLAALKALNPQPPGAAELSETLRKEIELLKAGQLQNACAVPLDALDPISAAWMAARLDPGLQIQDVCIIAPDAKYRGAENQLYRVEIHRGGRVGDANGPTFKWSCDNGSVLTPWLGTEGDDLIVKSGRGFEAGCWVEISDDSNDWNAVPGTLVKLANVVGDRLSMDPATKPSGGLTTRDPDLHPKVRRWDQRENDVTTLDDGAIPIVEGAGATNWGITLEDGIEVQFANGGQYRTGDYWLIPARVATGDIEWPTNTDSAGKVTPVPQPPAGIEHHYAPLAIISGKVQDTSGKVVVTTQTCRICCDPLVSAACALTQPPAAGMSPKPAPGGGVIVMPKETAAGPSSTPKGAPAKRPKPK
jgi:hypothetical protein